MYYEKRDWYYDHSLFTSLNIVDHLAHLIKNVPYISNNKFFYIFKEDQEEGSRKKTILESDFQYYILYNLKIFFKKNLHLLEN